MNVITNEILLLKAQDDENDKYGQLLISNGFTVQHLPVLDFEYINTFLLQEKLKNVDIFNGIIFTSPRAVLATKLSLNSKKLDKKWYNKNNYVVGETTYDLVCKELGIVCKGKDSGNANNLSDLIIKENCTGCKFLFPCGNLKKETLCKQLKEQSIELDATTVYETIENPNILENFNIISSNCKNIPEYIVYFSPSGVKYTIKIFKELNIDLEKLKLVSIGPSTEDALRFENLSVYSVAKKPTAGDLLNAILNK